MILAGIFRHLHILIRQILSFRTGYMLVENKLEQLTKKCNKRVEVVEKQRNENRLGLSKNQVSGYFEIFTCSDLRDFKLLNDIYFGREKA